MEIATHNHTKVGETNVDKVSQLDRRYSSYRRVPNNGISRPQTRSSRRCSSCSSQRSASGWRILSSDHAWDGISQGGVVCHLSNGCGVVMMMTNRTTTGMVDTIGRVAALDLAGAVKGAVLSITTTRIRRLAQRRRQQPQARQRMVSGGWREGATSRDKGSSNTISWETVSSPRDRQSPSRSWVKSGQARELEGLRFGRIC